MNRQSFRRRFWIRVVGVLLALSPAVTSCNGKTSGPQGGSDGVSHWLKECALDSECGGLDCLCGVCTSQCTEADSCGRFGDSAVCVPAQGPSCSLDGPDRVCARADHGGGGFPGMDGGAAMPGRDAGTGTEPRTDSGAGSPVGSDGAACDPFEARSSGNDCLVVSGYAFSGTGCEPIVCGCVGSDCDKIYQTAGECRQAHALCLSAAGDPCAPNGVLCPAFTCNCMPQGIYWDGSACLPGCCAGPNCGAGYASMAECVQARLSCITLQARLPCQAHEDCALEDVGCCTCGERGPSLTLGIHRDSVAGYRNTVCGNEPACTPDCVQTVSPTLYPTCHQRACEVLDVAPYAACTADEDCTVAFKDCCTCGADGSPDGVVAVSDVEGFLAQICPPLQGCPECVGPPLPAGVTARCEASRCVLDGVTAL